MPPLKRIAVALTGALAFALLVGCENAEKDGADDSTQAAGGRTGAAVSLAANTCWSEASLSNDPQAVLELSRTYAVDYFAVAHAVDERPAFARTQACDAPHSVEVYKVVPVDQVKPVVTNYAGLLKFGRPAYTKLSTALEVACMSPRLAKVATLSKVPGAVVKPALPEGIRLGWAPPSPEQWNSGQRVYACTLSSAKPMDFGYAALFTKELPTSLRTCISNTPLSFVDCARKHHRERVAVFDVRTAVAAKKFPGRSAIKVGSQGPFVQLSAPVLAALDRACTAYLRSVSTTPKLTGVVEIDAAAWPTPEGAYPIDCEADAPPTTDSIVTTGSVFNR